MIGIVFAAALACQFGSWSDEVTRLKEEGWQYQELSKPERDTVIKRYAEQSHEWIDAPHAWIEKQSHFGAPTTYSIAFTDDAGCIVFHLNFAQIENAPRRDHVGRSNGA